MRPVVNLKGLNEYIVHHHFKMEGLHTLRELLKPGDWMAKVDLKDAYFMIPIHDANRPLLRFMAIECHYQFTCLPFGLSCAPWAFTKILKPVAATLRELGVRLVIYIDDILVVAESEGKVRDHTLGQIYLLENMGFIVHPEKTVIVPTQEIQFLGMQVDSHTLELQVPGLKLKKVQPGSSQVREAVSTSLSLRVFSTAWQDEFSFTSSHSSPLLCRGIQRDLATALRRGSQLYEVPCPLSS